MLYKYLKLLNPNINVKPLFHTTRSHGLKDMVEQILEDKPNLIICPDSASGDFEQHKILKDNGIDCLILDHHTTDKYSENAIVINNKLSSNVVNKAGSGCLVTWKFLKALDLYYGVNFAPNMIDMVYFSLLSDICDMDTQENRAFAYYGARSIKNKFLITMCDELLPNKEINNRNISWIVQPKISDIIRCDNQEIKEDLFYALAEEKQECIDNILSQYSDIHNKRKKYVQEYFNNMDYINEDNNIIFEEVEDLYGYYTGLVGSKINDKYNKPCMLYREPKDDKIIGSVRSPYPIKQQLKDSNLFDWVEGHDSALGCQFDINNIELIKKFVKEINLDDSRNVASSFSANNIPRYLFSEFEDYSELWGQQIPEPTFHIHSIKINSNNIRVMGGNKTTIKFSYEGVDYLKFFTSHAEQDEVFYIGQNKDLEVEIIGTLQENRWRGTNTPQVIIERFEMQNMAKKAKNWEEIF